MSVRATPAGMAPTAPTVSTATPAPALLASAASTVRSTPTTALTALASMVAPAWMELMPSPACVYLDSLGATASMISMSATPNRASTEALVSTVMGRTSAHVLMATWESIVRILCAGVIHPPVKMEVHAGSREPPTPASVRLDGLVSIVTSPVCLVRLQPNSKGWRWLTCAGTQASVWMLEAHITAAARLATLGATARNKWMSAHPILARMEPPVLIIWEATAVSVSPATTA